MPQRLEDTKFHKEYNMLSDDEEIVGKAIVNAAYKVHKELGPGLLGS